MMTGRQWPMGACKHTVVAGLFQTLVVVTEVVGGSIVVLISDHFELILAEKAGL